ncbi:MAG TPA: CSLREA domain-containing protein [Moraxellaceae bacterium]|nr:CSLREA domain-containing protein [Moraxellaceae bacterium]
MKKVCLPLVAGLLVLCAGAPRASLVTTINVTTTADEDGANPSRCSLREAVKAVNSRKGYGGCPAGAAFTDNLIQLDPGTYVLTRGELYITNDIIIKGADSQKEAHDEVTDPLTGVKPRSFRPDYEDADPLVGKTGTYIVAQPGRRIFSNAAALNLEQLVLEGSASSAQTAPAPVADNGGIIFATSSVSLRNVVVRGGSVSGGSAAAGNGGAIYLAGDNTTLTLTDVSLEGNHADNKGGAVAMLCTAGLNPYALHNVTASRSLFRGNSASAGAGAIEFCGNTVGTITASTFSANSSAPSSGALAYVQGSAVGLGVLYLNYITAVEQVGHIIAANGLSALNITGSLLSAFQTPGATSVCFNPDAAVEWAASNPAGSYNAYDNDGSCSALMVSNNVLIPLLTPLTDVLVPIRTRADYYPASATGAPFGLTDYYLPKVAVGSPILDRAQEIGSCLSIDQRGVQRRSGTACDIGAIERLQITARDDVADSTLDTDRQGIVDVLANDSFGEDDTTGPYKFAANTPDDPATTPANELSPSVVLVDDAGGRCSWKLSDDADYPGMMVVENKELTPTPAEPPYPNGELTTDDAPITCTYRVVDTNSTSAAVGTVKVQIKNQAPNAVNDSYLRPVGEAEVMFNPLDNDNDKGDGKFGLVLHVTPNANPLLPPTRVYGPEVNWASFYPIEIVDQPSLGKVFGASSGLCPGSSSVPKICLNPPLRYVADNNMSPFTDTFTYHVYDADGQNSGNATVSIRTDAPDPDHGGGAGSLDWLAGIALGLLGLRRFRRL